ADYHIYSYRKGTDLAKKHSNVILAEIGMDILKSFTCAFNGENHLWVGDNAGRIYCIDPETGIVNKYKLPDIDEAIQNLFVSSNNETVYVYTRQRGMYEYNVKNDQLQRHLLNLNGAISHAFVDKYDKIWLIENENALLYYDPQNKIEKRFPVSQGRRVTDMQVRDVGEQGLFILTPAGEMLIFERESLSMTRLNQATSFPVIPQTPLFFNQEFDDDDGMLWLSSSSGIYCVNFLPKQFRLFGLQTFKRATLYTEKEVLNPSINALFRAQNGDIWIGTQQNLYLIDKSGQLKEVFMTLTHPTISNVCHIMEDNKGNLWFSTKGEGVIKAIPDAQALYGFRFVRYTNNPEVLSSLGSNNVRFTFQDSKDRIWLGLLNGGLNLLQEEADKVSFKHKYNGFKQYPLSYGSYMEVRGMVEDTDGRIWVGTTDGLMSFEVNFDEPEDIVFETYLNQTSASPICNDNISMLYKDTDFRIWVGLFGGGLGELIGYDREAQKPIFKSYGASNGLRNDVIVSIAEDDSRNLWFVTENGLSCFDKQTERFRNYDRLDGFPGITLGEIQALISSKGEFWFGCKEGILAFSPDKLETHKYNYKTYILDFRINGKENPPMDTPIKYASEVEVEYDQSTFTIEFVALDYSNRDNISYEYILEGYEKEWHFNGNNRIASYTGVSPGKYKFRVRSINEVDSESLSESTLTIRILPPWKSSWYTYALYIIIIGIIAIISKLVMMLIKAKNEAYIKRRLSELKIKFFTYISHEMRIPLTLIKSPIQEL
ncbi:Sensor histidine kinase TmoS, partial [termite gut metagenome]